MSDRNKKPFQEEEGMRKENRNTEPSGNTDRADENNRTNDPSEAIGRDQGRASFTTGSTTQGGSNYGQGSSHLGGSSNQQGDKKNAGSNYENESDRFGNTGTQAEGYNPPGEEAQKGFAAHTQAGKQNTSAGEDDNDSKQKGGGATGYDVEREQEQVNREQDKMHSERDLDRLSVEEHQDPSRQNEGTPNIDTPGTPNIPPSTPNTPGSGPAM
ncbi:MAG: hypothetical protein EOP56_04260 [Sphingobacteriales bacterium]|nr:MAG: hypothetical protein EOP56_04260 [Sphingobacteriales bacterium]